MAHNYCYSHFDAQPRRFVGRRQIFA